MTVKVRTLKEHGNRAGPKYRKEAGDEYELPDDRASSLAAIGLVEIVADDETKDAAPARGKSRKRK